MFEDLSGAALAVALDSVDVAALDADGALGYALAARRLDSWATAREAIGWSRLHASYPDDPEGLVDFDRAVVHEIGAAVGCSSRSASKRLGMAQALADLPATFAALESGVIDVPRAMVMIEHTTVLIDPAQRRAVEKQVLDEHAEADSGLTMRQWHRVLARAVATVDPSAAETRHRQAKTDREVQFCPPSNPGGDASLFLRGPADQLAEAEAAIDALARRWRYERRRDGGCDETLAQLRFDAAVWLLTHPQEGRLPAGVVVANITVPLSSLLGLDDSPGELDRVGPVPASVARELAARAGIWRRLVTDPIDGRLVTQHIKTYRPPDGMATFVHVRAGGVCASRGCGATRGLQDDHVVEHPHGPTSSDNLCPCCQSDHNFKTHGGWRHQLDPQTGALTQTSPLGRTYTTVPLPPPASTGARAGPVTCPACLQAHAASPDPDSFDEEEDCPPPLGESPPGEDEDLPPDPQADHDRWPIIQRRLREQARAEQLAMLADHRALAVLHAALDADTDHDLIAAINADDLARLNEQRQPADPCHPDDLDAAAALRRFWADLEAING